MGDFFQNGEITTLQELGKRDYKRYDAEMNEFSLQKPLALVLPTLFTDIKGPAMPRILDELEQVPYLSRIVVSLGGAKRDQYKETLALFSRLPQPVDIIWNGGQRMLSILRQMEEHGIYLGEPGKGVGAWMAYGLILGDASIRAIALHDCDIMGYNRILLHRLAYPVMNPLLDYEFSKGYYARVSDRLYGRATRLFVTPLLRALQKILGRTPFLVYLDSFRYPLAGEFCMGVDAARINKIPSDKGFEIGTVSEVFRNYSTRRICQVDLGMDYEHRHQTSGFTDPKKGIVRMAHETALSLFHTLAGQGEVLSDPFFRTLRAAYVVSANDAIRQYSNLSDINGLVYDRDSEEVFIDYFAKTLGRAATEFLEDPTATADLPNWNRVKSVIPDIYSQLRAIVEEDREE